MTRETVASEALEMDTLTLHSFIDENVVSDHSDEKTVVYVMDDTGRQFERVSLVKQTLTDGSFVYNLVLS